MTAALLVTLYALAPPLLLWRYWRLAGHGPWWDVGQAANLAVNALAAGLFVWDETFAIEPGQWGYDALERAGWAALVATMLNALVLALKPWPVRETEARPRRRRGSGTGRREPVVSTPKKGGAR